MGKLINKYNINLEDGDGDYEGLTVATLIIAGDAATVEDIMNGALANITLKMGSYARNKPTEEELKMKSLLDDVNSEDDEAIKEYEKKGCSDHGTAYYNVDSWNGGKEIRL